MELLVATVSLLLSVMSVGGQINAGCTNDIINSFGPCLSFVTGSGANSVSPTGACCNSLKSLMGSSMDCACLVVSGNIPLPVPINRTLAVTLPKACKSLGPVPIQCPIHSNISPPAPESKMAGSPPMPLAGTPAAAPPPPSLDAPAPTTTTDNTGLNRPLFTPLSAAPQSSYIGLVLLQIISLVLGGLF